MRVVTGEKKHGRQCRQIFDTNQSAVESRRRSFVIYLVSPFSDDVAGHPTFLSYAERSSLSVDTIFIEIVTSYRVGLNVTEVA